MGLHYCQKSKPLRLGLQFQSRTAVCGWCWGKLVIVRNLGEKSSASWEKNDDFLQFRIVNFERSNKIDGIFYVLKLLLYVKCPNVLRMYSMMYLKLPWSWSWHFCWFQMVEYFRNCWIWNRKATGIVSKKAFQNTQQIRYWGRCSTIAKQQLLFTSIN